MSAGDLAAVIVVISSIVAVVLLVFAVMQAISTMRSLRDTVEALRVEAIPAVSEMRKTAERAGEELERVDGLLDSAESISATVDSASRLTYLAVSNPLIKLMAFGAGTARAARRLGRRSD